MITALFAIAVSTFVVALAVAAEGLSLMRRKNDTLDAVEVLTIEMEQQVRSTRHAMKNLDAAVRLMAGLPPAEPFSVEVVEVDEEVASR